MQNLSTCPVLDMKVNYTHKIANLNKYFYIILHARNKNTMQKASKTCLYLKDKTFNPLFGSFTGVLHLDELLYIAWC